MSRYQHFSIEERERIQVMRARGESVREIGRCLGRAASSISRELRRCEGEYSPSRAQQNYWQRRRKSVRKYILLKEPELRNKVEKLLEAYCSPEQIAGRLALEGQGKISFVTIYRGLERGILLRNLKGRLRWKGRRYRKGHGGRTGQIQADKWIRDSPVQANNRQELGHWESDTVQGSRGSGAVSTHVDRKSRYVLMTKLEDKRAEDFVQGMISCFASIPQDKLRSFTVDHGKEFAKYKDIEQALNVTVYFADVGNPGQRGTNENTNGLIRQWLPKRTSFKDVTQQDLDRLADLLNFRPRKSLGWLTPFEVFHSQVLHLI